MHEHEEARRHGFAVKQSFSTSVGTVEVLLDEQSRIVSAYRFNAEGRPVAAALESWDHTDLAELLGKLVEAEAFLPYQQQCANDSANHAGEKAIGSKITVDICLRMW